MRIAIATQQPPSTFWEVAVVSEVPNTRAIMRALKATGPTSSTTGQYGTVSAPSISPGPSPLVASYNEWTSGHASGQGGALPREWQSFLSGMFGPLAPIKPVPIDVPDDGDDRPLPRRFQYPIGWDMPMGMPGTEGLGKLADFNTLRTLADLYSVARSCIELRKSELRGIGWDIALTRDAAKSLRGDRDGMKDFSDRRAKAVKFFRRPDPRYPDFSSWFDALLEEVFVTDAMSLYIHPTRQRGKGLLGSSIGALDLLDGSLIRPLVDIRGGVPVPPNVAYQQYEYGVPRVDLMSLLTGDSDLPAGMTAEYRGDQLLYLPFSPRTWTPYGQAPIERAIIPVMSGLNKQQFQLNFFQEGSIPGLFVSPGDANMTPAQIRELQDALNALAGDQAWKHKIIVLPGGSKVDPQKPITLADQFDEIVMTQVCMAFSVMPMELGISPKVSATQSSGAANQMAKASQDIQERKGTVPLLMWLKAAVFDKIIQEVCGQDDLEWQWEGLEEDEDVETLTSLLIEQVSAGLRSIDEARQELGLDPWNMPVTSDPGWATQRTGFMPFTVGLVGASEVAPGQSVPGQPALPQAAAASATAQAAAQAAKPAPAATPTKVPGQAPAITPPSGGAGQLQQGAPQGTPPGKPHPGPPAPPITSGGDSTSGTPAHAGASAARKPTGKARELDLLRNHLRKGRPVSSWTTRDLPGALLAAISEDLEKGLTIDQVCDLAGAGIMKAGPGRGDLTHEVYAYLAKHYPAAVLGWVMDAEWAGPMVVPLDQVNMARRNQSARNPAKVEAIAARIRAGETLDPIVLVETPGDPKLQIADGWHRTLARQHEGRTSIRAWVGKVDTSDGPWTGAMNAAKLNKDDTPGGGDGGPKGPDWPGWAKDQEIAARYAYRLVDALRDAIPAHELAAAWLAAVPPPATKGRRRKGTARHWLEQAGVLAAIAALLRQLLTELWAEAWRVGWRSAETVLGQEIAEDQALLAQMIQDGAERIDGIAVNRLGVLETLLEDADEPGSTITADELASGITDAITSVSTAELITQTETTWSMAEGALGMYYQARVATVGWATADDDRVCPVCNANEAAGLLPIGRGFPSGDSQPPAHPRCRCALYPGDILGQVLPLSTVFR